MGMMMPEMNWALKLAWIELVVLLVELPDRLFLAPEDLDDGVAGVRLLHVPGEANPCAPTAGRTASANAWR